MVVQYIIPFDAFTSVARIGSTQAWNLNLSSAQSSDDARVYMNPVPMGGSNQKMQWLQGLGLSTAANYLKRAMDLRGVEIVYEVDGSSTTVIKDDLVHLITSSTIRSSTNVGLNTAIADGDVVRYGALTRADWQDAFGLTLAVLKSNPSDVGAVLGLTADDSVSVTGDWPRVDRLALRVTVWEPSGGLLLDRELFKHGGLVCLLEEAIPTISSSTAIFANAPTGTKAILMSVYSGGADVLVMLDGGTALTTKGLRYYAGDSAQLIPIAYDQALLAKAIQSAATATGWIVYLGLP